MFSKSTKLPLNQGQEAVAKEFFDFLLDPNATEFNISGPGGTGKTFLMSHLIDDTMPAYMETCSLMGAKPLYNEVVMTATTNKAAEVLAQATGRPTSTYHSFQGLIVKNDFKTGETNVVPSKSFAIKRNKIIFVDEASMIDKQLLKYAREGTHQSKLVFVGDASQLLPVKENKSPVYAGNIPTHYLTEQMRTDKPELKALHQQLRDTVNGVTGFLPIKCIPGIIDWVQGEEMEKLVLEHFCNHTDSRIVAYTNDQVINYNNYIREANGYKGEYSIGEELVSNSAVKLGVEDRLSIEQEVKLIDQDSSTRMVRVVNDIELEVRDSTLDLGYGGIVSEVPVPTDPDYFNRLVKWLGKDKNWEPYFRMKETIPDLRATHACTVHKSQGSTYDTIFIDATDLSSCRQPDMVARLLYVAVSRARCRVVFYGELAKKYGGLTF
ncbi:MAG: hypothetical protein [Caudoviricetes sp.]|nr:MAG: hypothetical protein [Caudoviricetes sp.]